MNTNTVIMESCLSGSKDESPVKESHPKRSYDNLKEENDKLRTYLGLVKMCNLSAIEKIKSALEDTLSLSQECQDQIMSEKISKQVDIMQTEINNLTQMHSKLMEGMGEMEMVSGEEDGESRLEKTLTVRDDNMNELNGSRSVIAQYEIQRKSTGLKRSFRNLRAKGKRDNLNENLLSRICVSEEKRSQMKKCLNNEQNRVMTEDDQALSAAIESIPPPVEEQDGENVTVVKEKVGKKIVNEEFKSSHQMRLVEAKRRREELNRQSESSRRKRSNIRKKREEGKTVESKSPKKKVNRKKDKNSSMTPKKSISVKSMGFIGQPKSDLEYEHSNAPTIQIIHGNGTQILCRSDGTFVPNNWQIPTPTPNPSQWSTNESHNNNYNQNECY